MDTALSKNIIESLPYGKDFLFVDNIIYVDNHKITGEYFFHKNHSFYHAHFKTKPVTPGVILLECMGQTGLVAHGIYLLNPNIKNTRVTPVLSYVSVDFFKPVFPDTHVIIQGEKQYFRHNLLKSKIALKEKSTGNTIAISEAICKFLLIN